MSWRGISTTRPSDFMDETRTANSPRTDFNLRLLLLCLFLRDQRAVVTATTWNVEPTSSPAAFGLIVASCPDDRARVPLLAGMLHLPCKPREQDWAQGITFLNGIARSVTTIKCASHPRTMFFNGLASHH
jgi:hypothetical protein